MSSNVPTVLLWGRELRVIFNSAVLDIFGDETVLEHFAQSLATAWPEAWRTFEPFIQRALGTRTTSFHNDVRFLIHHNGKLHERHISFSAHVVPSLQSSSVLGIMVTVTDTTANVLANRRLQTLWELPTSLSGTTTTSGVCSQAASVMAANPRDVPFALFYLFDSELRKARLVAATGVRVGASGLNRSIDLASDGDAPDELDCWNLRQVMRTTETMLAQCPPALVMDGDSDITPHEALVTPLATPDRKTVLGAVVYGMNPYLCPDEEYRQYLDLASQRVGSVIAASRLQAMELERTRMLQQFLQTAAHELRNPMAAIKSMAELLQFRITGGKPVGDLPAHIGDEVDRLAGLLNTTLEAFRYQRGQPPTHLRKLNLVDVLARSLETFQVLAGDREFKTNWQPDDTVILRGDATHLGNAFRNLLANAVQYSPVDRPILVSLNIANHRAVVTIEDKGIGIPQQELNAIFSGFYRASNVLGRGTSGMGLGLFISREIVERHGGRIWAVSEEGAGTTLFIELPLA